MIGGTGAVKGHGIAETGLHGNHLSYVPLSDPSSDLSVGRYETGLHGFHKKDAALPGGHGYKAHLLFRHGRRLFAKNSLSCSQCPDGPLTVKAMGKGQIYGIDPVILKETVMGPESSFNAVPAGKILCLFQAPAAHCRDPAAAYGFHALCKTAGYISASQDSPSDHTGLLFILKQRFHTSKSVSSFCRHSNRQLISVDLRESYNSSTEEKHPEPEKGEPLL